MAETNALSTSMLYELNFHSPWTWMHFAEYMVCVGVLMAGGAGGWSQRPDRSGESYKEQNCIIFNCLGIALNKKVSV